jgi:hypothetical protein
MVEKGVAFPVCVSVNDIICNLSPLASEELVSCEERVCGMNYLSLGVPFPLYSYLLPQFCMPLTDILCYRPPSSPILLLLLIDYDDANNLPTAYQTPTTTTTSIA